MLLSRWKPWATSHALIVAFDRSILKSVLKLILTCFQQPFDLCQFHHFPHIILVKWLQLLVHCIILFGIHMPLLQPLFLALSYLVQQMPIPLSDLVASFLSLIAVINTDSSCFDSLQPLGHWQFLPHLDHPISYSVSLPACFILLFNTNIRLIEHNIVTIDNLFIIWVVRLSLSHIKARHTFVIWNLVSISHL